MMSQASKRELIRELRPRYTLGTRADKRRILDELVATTGYHRKYAIHLLNHPPPRAKRAPKVRRRKYNGRVVAALERVWRAANCICGKRLAPVLATYVEALERHGELVLEAETRTLLGGLSAATVDRLLQRARQQQRPHGRATTKPGTLLKHSIPIRTFAQWDERHAGFMEVDLVAHGGPSSEGEYLHSLNMIDIQTRWNEFVGLVNRSQATVTAAVDGCRRRLPFRLLGLDSDNGSEFINGDLKRYCEQQHITFTRSRPYRKNDQAYVEQKNWTTVRQAVGYDRFEGQAACDALNALYGPLRLYINFFQPVMVLIAKEQDGARVHKTYDEAQTPYQRVLDCPDVPEEAKTRLRQFYLTLNPLRLLRQIQAAQQALWQLACHPACAILAADASSGGTQVPPHPLLLEVTADADANLNESPPYQVPAVRSAYEATIPLW